MCLTIKLILGLSLIHSNGELSKLCQFKTLSGGPQFTAKTGIEVESFLVQLWFVAAANWNIWWTVHCTLYSGQDTVKSSATSLSLFLTDGSG